MNRYANYSTQYLVRYADSLRINSPVCFNALKIYSLDLIVINTSNKFNVILQLGLIIIESNDSRIKINYR